MIVDRVQKNIDWKRDFNNNNDKDESFVRSVPSRRVTHIFPEHYRILSQPWHPPARTTSHHVSMGPAAPFVRACHPSWGLVVAGQQWEQPHLRLRSTCCASWLFFHRTITIPVVSFRSSLPIHLSLPLSLSFSLWKPSSSKTTNSWMDFPSYLLSYLCGKLKKKKKKGEKNEWWGSIESKFAKICLTTILFWRKTMWCGRVLVSLSRIQLLERIRGLFPNSILECCSQFFLFLQILSCGKFYFLICQKVVELSRRNIFIGKEIFCMV